MNKLHSYTYVKEKQNIFIDIILTQLEFRVIQMALKQVYLLFITVEFFLSNDE